MEIDSITQLHIQKSRQNEAQIMFKNSPKQDDEDKNKNCKVQKRNLGWRERS